MVRKEKYRLLISAVITVIFQLCMNVVMNYDVILCVISSIMYLSCFAVIVDATFCINKKQEIKYNVLKISLALTAIIMCSILFLGLFTDIKSKIVIHLIFSITFIVFLVLLFFVMKNEKK